MRAPRVRAAMPHPVVGHGDDVAGAFEAKDPSVSADEDEIVIAFCDIGVTNPTVASLIAEGRASILVRVFCRATYFRRTFEQTQSSFEIRLPATRLIDDVEVGLRVCAKAPLPAYRPDGLHADYPADVTFAVVPGDVLAEGPSFAFDASKDFDPLAGRIDSIMTIEKHPDPTHLCDALFDHRRIRVRLGADDWARYTRVKHRLASVVHVGIVLPVIAEAIRLLRDSSEECEDQVWSSRLQRMLDVHPSGLRDDPPYLAAQKILDAPLRRAFESLDNLIDGDG